MPLLASMVDVVCWVLLVPLLGVVGYRTVRQSEHPERLILKWLVSLGLIILIEITLDEARRHPPTALWCILPFAILGFLWIPSFIAFLSQPLTGAFDGGTEVAEARPYYFLAEGKRRKGQYEEAIAAIRQQLERFPGDYEGVMKLASIQMVDMKNLPAAVATLEEFLSLPQRPPNEIVSILHLLADWQLEYGRDAAAATAALQRIVERYPGQSAAHAAAQRIAHLGEADQTRRVRDESHFTVQAAERDPTGRKPVEPVATADPQARAEELVKHLEKHPSDTEAREKLAVL
jgi:tetratricopeptide (TPR) repeat protein